MIGLGFFGAASAWFGLLAAAAAIGGFWVGGRLLARDVRSRLQQPFGPPQPADRRPPIDAGEYVVIRPSTR